MASLVHVDKFLLDFLRFINKILAIILKFQRFDCR